MLPTIGTAVSRAAIQAYFGGFGGQLAGAAGVGVAGLFSLAAAGEVGSGGGSLIFEGELRIGSHGSDGKELRLCAVLDLRGLPQHP